MKKIKDKLSSIDGLKEMQKQGKELEKNQVMFSFLELDRNGLVLYGN